MSRAIELKVGRTYRAKRPAQSDGLVNDRTIKWIGIDGLQYDGPTAAFGRHYPRTSIEAFLKWADRDVTDELPEGEYAPWPITKTTGAKQ